MGLPDGGRRGLDAFRRSAHVGVVAERGEDAFIERDGTGSGQVHQQST